MNTKNVKDVVTRPGKKMILVAATAMALAIGCKKPNVDVKDLKDFKQVNLVANNSKYAPLTIDPTLINAFGIAWSPTGIAWVNSAGGHVSELYTSEGGIARQGVNIPTPTDSINGFPCGIVFSSGKGFNLANGPSAFLFTSFDGVLSGWNGASGNNAKRIKAPAGASFTGLAIASNGGRNFIYGANFGKSRIVVWDTAFNLVSMPFVDPSLPAKYSPYNIQAVGDYLFVMYAVLGDDGHGVSGAGNGYVSVFKTDGTFLKRFASRGTLNIPWGVTMAPGSFLEDNDMGDGNDDEGGYGDKSDLQRGKHDPKDPVILVGNFGDGRINVFSQDGIYLGQLQSHKHTIVIEGLWALTFPPATANIDSKRLYFSAGPANEADGVFGYVIKQ
ncbi:MAG TPA: TIGR03118 family protein [Chitinophagaceae bacterium]|nr:TIGR03118 family protein [Chitinophagaceae bacterium]